MSAERVNKSNYIVVPQTTKRLKEKEEGKAKAKPVKVSKFEETKSPTEPHTLNTFASPVSVTDIKEESQLPESVSKKVQDGVSDSENSSEE